MDEGRCLNNIFAGSLKFEDVYVRAYGTRAEARAGIGNWIMAYNRTCPHPALGCQTSDEVLHGTLGSDVNHSLDPQEDALNSGEAPSGLQWGSGPQDGILTPW